MSALATFARRQRVRTLYRHSEAATIVGRHPADHQDGHWYVIRFDEGGGGSVHASMMAPANEPSFKGRLETYRQSQRQ